MGVERLHKQVLFDGISSELRMCKISAIGMLFKVFSGQILQFKTMTTISNAIKHYQFSSCLHTYLFACSLIQYPKTAQKTVPYVLEPCERTRSNKNHTPNLMAAT